MFRNVIFSLLIHFTISYTDRINQGLQQFYGGLDLGNVLQSSSGRSIILPEGETTQIFQDKPVLLSSQEELSENQIKAKLALQNSDYINDQIQQFVDPLAYQVRSPFSGQQATTLSNQQMINSLTGNQDLGKPVNVIPPQYPQFQTQKTDEKPQQRKIVAQAQITFDEAPDGQLINLERISQPLQQQDGRYSSLNNEQRQMLNDYELLLRQQKQQQEQQSLQQQQQQLDGYFKALGNVPRSQLIIDSEVQLNPIVQQPPMNQSRQRNQNQRGAYEDVVYQFLSDIQHRDFAQQQISNYQQGGSQKVGQLDQLINQVVQDQQQNFMK